MSAVKRFRDRSAKRTSAFFSSPLAIRSRYVRGVGFRRLGGIVAPALPGDEGSNFFPRVRAFREYE